MASRKQELLGMYLDQLRGETYARRSTADARRRLSAMNFTPRRSGHKVQGDNVSLDVQGRRQARDILDAAVGAKSISRSDLKKAISLYAGPQATASEQAAVGSKMLDLLNKRQVKFTT